MDAKIKGKISFLGTLNQQLASVSTEADDEYNRIIKTYFDSNFFKVGGLSGGIPALLVSPAAAHFSPASVAGEISTVTASTAGELSAVTTDVWIDGVLYSGTVEGAATAAASTGTELAVVGSTGTELAVAGSTGTELALAGGSGVSTAGTAAGASAAGGGAVLGTACAYVAAAIAIYFSVKYITKAVLNKAWVKQGEKKLKSLRTDIVTMRVYCNSMTSNLESAINNLSLASEKIAIAEKKIAKQQYATRDSNLKAIRERQAEVVGLCKSLRSTIDLVKIVKTNLDLLV